MIISERYFQNFKIYVLNGEKAQILDRYGNSREISFNGHLKAPKGKFKAELTTAGSLNGLVQNAKLTLGFTGKE